MENSPPRIIAHRGASVYAPENTLRAFKKAVEFGAHWIELDCRLTKDNIPIVIHDATLYRTTRRTGSVRLLTAWDIHARSIKWIITDPGYTDWIPPTLEEVLLWARGKVNVYIELKSRERLLIQKVGSMILELDLEKEVVVESFYFGQLQHFSSLFPSIPIEFLVTCPSKTGIRKALDCWARGINCNHRWLTVRMVKKIHEAGLQVGVYTINSPVAIYRLMSWGVDTIFSDVPDIALNVANLYASNPDMKRREVRLLIKKSKMSEP